MNFQAIAQIISAASTMANILAQLVHGVGKVNHPVVLDQVNVKLAEVNGIVQTLAGGSSAPPPAP